MARRIYQWIGNDFGWKAEVPESIISTAMRRVAERFLYLKELAGFGLPAQRNK
jgi:hypothetical protein